MQDNSEVSVQVILDQKAKVFPYPGVNVSLIFIKLFITYVEYLFHLTNSPQNIATF